MSLVTSISKEKTREDYLQEKVERIDQINVEVYGFLVQRVLEAFNIVQTPNAPTYGNEEPKYTFTTQEVIDCLEANGKSSLKYFMTSGKLQDFLVFSSDGEYQRLIPKPFSVADGKIVCPEPIEVLPEEEIIN